MPADKELDLDPLKMKPFRSPGYVIWACEAGQGACVMGINSTIYNKQNINSAVYLYKDQWV